MRTQLLRPNQCMPLPVEAGAVLRCTRGVLWLTFEPRGRQADCLDRVLTPGAEWQVGARGTVFVTAVRSHAEAAFCLHEAAR